MPGSNPREKGFNYGVGSGSGPKPPLYIASFPVLRIVRGNLQKQVAEAWAFEMAHRAVRLAENGVEMAMALAALEIEYAKHA